MDKDKSRRLAGSTLNISAYYGIYEAIRFAWKAAEKAELGYDIETMADSTACLFLSLFVWIILRVMAE